MKVELPDFNTVFVFALRFLQLDMQESCWMMVDWIPSEWQREPQAIYLRAKASVGRSIWPKIEVECCHRQIEKKIFVAAFSCR